MICVPALELKPEMGNGCNCFTFVPFPPIYFFLSPFNYFHVLPTFYTFRFDISSSLPQCFGLQIGRPVFLSVLLA